MFVLHSEFEIAAEQLGGRFRKFGTIDDNTSFLSIKCIYLWFKRGVLGAEKCNFLQKWPNLQDRLELICRLFFCMNDFYFVRFLVFKIGSIYFARLSRNLKNFFFEWRAFQFDPPHPPTVVPPPGPRRFRIDTLVGTG